MKASTLSALVLAVGGAAAYAADTQPDWLARKIALMESLPPASPARAFYRVEFNGRTAYLLTPTCCDIPAELYDEGGELICYPYGGFAPGDARCPGFSALRRTPPLWRDTRRDVRPRPVTSNAAGGTEP